MRKIIVYILAIGCFIFSFSPEKKINVYLIGDSTMCDQEISRTPVTGWGTPFKTFFDSSVLIDNRAKGGRSTRTFISENRWQSVSDVLKKGDYVFIQFGHNDEAKEPQYAARYTPVPDYKINLEKFIRETRAKKATPILLTPVSRMRFKDGVQQETHVEYTAAVFEVASQLKVAVIDLDKMSRDLYQQLGPENSKFLFMQLAPLEHPRYPDGQNDNTHFNDYGARRIAQIVLAEIKKLDLDLSSRIVVPVKKS